jgi:hypothetical protein
MSNKDSYQVFVKLANSKNIIIQVNSTDTVMKIRKLILDKISECNQFEDVFLCSGSKTLDATSETLTMQDYSIHKDSTIFVIPRLRGGYTVDN